MPAKVQIFSSEKARATVLVTNGGDGEAEHLRLRVAPNGNVTGATVKPSTSRSVSPGGSLAYQLTVPSWALAAPPTELTLLAEYWSEKTKQVTAAAVELLPPWTPEPDKVASVEVKASLATLRSGQSGPIYLLIHNKSGRSLTVERIVAKGPDFIEFEGLRRKTVVAPGQVEVREVTAVADSEVIPGEQQFVFRLPMQSGGSSFDLVASQTAKVAVAGESEVLTLLGVPSLLLLPGFLALATAAILWRLRLRRKEWDGETFPFPLKEPEFWVLAVVISIAAVIAAAALGLDLLGRYGLEDLIVIWIASMVAGAVGYLIAISLYTYWREGRRIESGDGPIEVLEKVGRQGLSLKRPRFSHGEGEKATQLFLLQAPDESRAASWAAPQVSYVWEGDDAELKAKIQAQLDEKHDAGALAALLRRGEERELLTTGFVGNPGGINGPISVLKEKIAPTASVVMAGEE